MVHSVQKRLCWPPAVSVLTALALWSWAPSAHAQYRNNGILIEAGAQTYEFLPYTVAAFASTKAAQLAWDQAHIRTGFPERPSNVRPCEDLRPYSFPCVNNWFGMTDGVYLGLGYQRVLGDLLVDVSESPLLESIVFTYRGMVGASSTLTGGAHGAPVFMVHQEPGIRWNMRDEKFRPYVGMNLGFNVFVDPFGLAGRVRNNQAACARQENQANLVGANGCQEDAGTFSFQGFSAQNAVWYMNSFPVMLSARPEVGVEWFFFEDISVQVFLSPNWYATILPQFITRPPGHGFSMRAGSSVVFYF